MSSPVSSNSSVAVQINSNTPTIDSSHTAGTPTAVQPDTKVLIANASEREFRHALNEKPHLNVAKQTPDTEGLKKEAQVLVDKTSAKNIKEAEDRVAQAGNTLNVQTENSSMISKIANNFTAGKLELMIDLSRDAMNLSHFEKALSSKSTQIHRESILKANEYNLDKTETLTTANNLTAATNMTSSVMSTFGSLKSNKGLKRSADQNDAGNTAKKMKPSASGSSAAVKNDASTTKTKPAAPQEANPQTEMTTWHMAGQLANGSAQINENSAKQQAAKEENLKNITSQDAESHSRTANASNDMANTSRTLALDLLKMADGAAMQAKSFISVKG